MILSSASSLVSSAQSTPVGSDWTGPENNYPTNWSYNPQNVINASNVNNMQVQWTFPVPEAPSPYEGAEGVMITPLVVGGIIYAVTNWHRIFALNAENGAVVWFQDLPLNQNFSDYLQPSIPAGTGYNTGAIGHYHAMLYTTEIKSQPLVWVVSNTYQIFALNALNGAIVLNFQPFPENLSSIPGNHGVYDQDTPMISIDQQRGILIFSPSVSEGTSGGRGFLEAFDLNAPQPRPMWRTFLMPPLLVAVFTAPTVLGAVAGLLTMLIAKKQSAVIPPPVAAEMQKPSMPYDRLRKIAVDNHNESHCRSECRNQLDVNFHGVEWDLVGTNCQKEHAYAGDDAAGEDIFLFIQPILFLGSGHSLCFLGKNISGEFYK
jgi:PQQ enzyme repeat